MRKHYKITAAFVMAASLTAGILGGCGSSGGSGETTAAQTEAVQTEESSQAETEALEPDEIPNPMEEVSGPEAFEEIGIHMAAPEGAENLACFMISGAVADMRFTLDGIDYTYRASVTAEDFAGIFERFKEETLTAGGEDGTPEILIKTTDSNGRLASWSQGETNYTLYTSHEMTDEAITQAALQTAAASAAE